MDASDFEPKPLKGFKKVYVSSMSALESNMDFVAKVIRDNIKRREQRRAIIRFGKILKRANKDRETVDG